MTLLLFSLFLAIGVSFLCSILEAVLLSVTPGFVGIQMEQRPRRAAALKEVKDDLEKSISAILILNTVAHTMGAAGVGAQAVAVFGPSWETLIAFLLTLAILYFSEIIPKTLGATYWPRLALPSAHIIRLLVKLLFPLVWLSARLSDMFSRGADMAAVSRDELAALARIGARHGALGSQESALLENILQLREIRTGEILTPRTVVSALDVSTSIGDALAQLRNVPFSRLPVFEGDLDTVVGMVMRPRLLEMELEGGGERPVGECQAPIHRVSEELPVLRLLDLFIKRREHLFLVEDEFGQTAGIVTLEDAVETLLGREIMDESDTVEDMQELARTKYRGRLRESR